MSPDIRTKLIKCVIPPVFWLGVWQLAASWVGMDLLLPSPLSVGTVLVHLVRTSAFWLTALSTLGRIFGGLLLGCLLGGLLAGLTYRFRWAELLLAPAVRVIRATPVVCFILLVYLWVARTRIPGVIAALMVLPVVWSNLDTGLRATDPQLLELARAYRFSAWKTVRLIYLPSLRPYWSSGFLTALGLAWKSGVAAEVIGLPSKTIGNQLYYAKVYLQTDELFAWTAAIIVLSIFLEKLLLKILKKLER